MKDLGERIKKLRKEKKLTLAQLAGERLTKGMLSLIENGKAQPSMESLHYIAERLGVEVTTLLNDHHVEQLRKLLFEMEASFKKIEQPFSPQDETLLLHMVEKIEVVREKLQGNHFEEVRLLDIYLRLATYLNIDVEFSMFDVIADYEKIHAYNRVVECFSFLASTAYKRNDYRIALQFIKEAEEQVEPYLHMIDLLTLLDMHYVLTVLYSAVDDVENTQKHLHFALHIAHENKIYYRLDDFYRFTLFQAIRKGDREKSAYYLMKLTQHAEFTEDPVAKSMLAFCKSHYANFIEQDYEAVARYGSYLDDKAGNEIVQYYKNEATYAFWARGLFNEALQNSEDFKISPNMHHPIDLSIMYQCFAVRALCFLELGNKEQAKKEVSIAVHGVQDFPNTIYKTFIQQAYEKIQYGKKG
ncbi:Xre family transcriptional regulator /transcriptional regulator [Ureibacillus xyleni]|uniref:Xre family transcriptional regulator /transcriptional regulator n=1 Tax=Ureibacillus xyleni TaxID=614648 RepID=A0A285SEV9_9BACL|nr:helix-turn-helix transcriptional regulator [Ureibacillus xyleni]SOC06291.1 Xre family transcriptional regulator /transcriptional regulator [Ureibacillus xyleni]